MGKLWYVHCVNENEHICLHVSEFRAITHTLHIGATRYLPTCDKLVDVKARSALSIDRLEKLLHLCHTLAVPAPDELPKTVNLKLTEDETIVGKMLQV